MERKIKLTPIKTESTSQDASGKKTYLDLANALVDAWNRINPPGTVSPDMSPNITVLKSKDGDCAMSVRISLNRFNYTIEVKSNVGDKCYYTTSLDKEKLAVTLRELAAEYKREIDGIWGKGHAFEVCVPSENNQESGQNEPANDEAQRTMENGSDKLQHVERQIVNSAVTETATLKTAYETVPQNIKKQFFAENPGHQMTFSLVILKYLSAQYPMAHEFRLDILDALANDFGLTVQQAEVFLARAEAECANRGFGGAITKHVYELARLMQNLSEGREMKEPFETLFQRTLNTQFHPSVCAAIQALKKSSLPPETMNFVLRSMQEYQTFAKADFKK